MAAARSWRPLVHGGRSFIEAVCKYWWLVYWSSLFIVAAYSFQWSIDLGSDRARIKIQLPEQACYS
jgi:hypothetical protein